MPRAVRHSGAMGKLEQERYATLVAMDILCVASRPPMREGFTHRRGTRRKNILSLSLGTECRREKMQT